MMSATFCCTSLKLGAVAVADISMCTSMNIRLELVLTVFDVLRSHTRYPSPPVPDTLSLSHERIIYCNSVQIDNGDSSERMFGVVAFRIIDSDEFAIQ